jgi:putative membrane protein
MKTIVTATVLGAFAFAIAAPAFALDAGKRASTTTMQEPAPSAEKTGAIPVTKLEPGANSFTEAQAKDRIKGAGFTNVGTLILDKDGIWRGSASKGAIAINVGLDFKGNVAVDAVAAK